MAIFSPAHPHSSKSLHFQLAARFLFGMKLAMSSHLHGSISSVHTYGVRVPELKQWIHGQLVVCLNMKKEQNME
jgi:hypothetical protein